MALPNGADVLLLINTGTEEAPTYVAVGSQRGMTIEETVDEIDTSSKDTGSKRVVGGRYGSTLSLDAVYVPDDASYLALKTAFRAKNLILVRVEVEDVETEEADCLITGMSSDYPDNDVATISIDLTVDGDWSEVGT